MERLIKLSEKKRYFMLLANLFHLFLNIQKLALKIEVSLNTILRVLDLLERGQVLNLLKSRTTGISYLQKPEKIYLQNPNLAFTFSNGKPDRGNLRKTFFFNQLQVSHQVSSSKYAD